MRPKWSRRRLSKGRSADHQRNTLIEFDVTFLFDERTGIYVIRAWLDRDSGVQSPIRC